jgi:methyltransferase (TIGR00027 family)
MTELFDIKISDVSTTLLLTLYCHALESQSKNPILNDPKAVELTQKLNPELLKSKDRFLRRLAEGKSDKNLVVHISMRAKRYDEYVRDFLKRSPNGIIVNIGCGLDTRFWRIDDGKTIFYDLDLPEVIAIKKKFFIENERYHFIASSVLDDEWFERLLQHGKGPYMFVAEGVFMYLPGEDVKSLVLKLQSRFPGSELVCEVCNDLWLHEPFKSMLNFKMQRQLHLGKGTSFNFGVKNSKEMEEWKRGIKFLDDWSYFDSAEGKMGWIRFLSNFEFLRKTQWTIHYQLN